MLLQGQPARSTKSVYEEIIAKSLKLDLKIAPLVDSIYNNQIRNALSHSEVWEVPELIVFDNHDFEKESSIPSLKFQTWDTLFKVTTSFMEALFSHRSDANSQLRQKAPYTVSLPEFDGWFTIVTDEHFGWSFVQ